MKPPFEFMRFGRFEMVYSSLSDCCKPLIITINCKSCSSSGETTRIITVYFCALAWGSRRHLEALTTSTFDVKRIASSFRWLLSLWYIPLDPFPFLRVMVVTIKKEKKNLKIVNIKNRLTLQNYGLFVHYDLFYRF